jgi:hypothetical protein
MGRYYITDAYTNGVVALNVDLADWLESLQLAAESQQQSAPIV